MSSEITRWGDSQQYRAAPQKAQGKLQVSLLQATEDPLGGIAAMCRIYEGKPTYSLAELSNEERIHYWNEVSKTHLKAPLEAVHMHFFIEGVDRAFTHQMVRQRTAAFGQESLRFAVIEDLPKTAQLPLSIRPDSDFAEVWEGALTAIQEAYSYLVNNGVPAEDARGLLPHVVPTRINYITNLRMLLEHAGNRLCTQAQFVWRMVFSQMIAQLQAREPHSWQWARITQDSFRPVCYELGRCPFKAGFDRACTIRDRVEAGRFDEIAIEEWLLNPAAARA